MYENIFTVFSHRSIFLTGETGPEAEQQHLLYDTWLVRHGEFLEGQVKYLEQQIQKQKRTKKAINARNRQVTVIS